jgi:hypothetical protein
VTKAVLLYQHTRNTSQATAARAAESAEGRRSPSTPYPVFLVGRARRGNLWSRWRYAEEKVFRPLLTIDHHEKPTSMVSMHVTKASVNAWISKNSTTILEHEQLDDR